MSRLSNPIIAISKLFLVWGVAYAFGWTAAYSWIIGADYKFYFTYLKLVWFGGGLEIPSFVQLIALIISIALTVGIIITSFYLREGEKKKNKDTHNLR